MKDAGEDAAAGACRAAGGDRRTMLGAAVRLTLSMAVGTGLYMMLVRLF